eukprot:366443-Chlamydomonas_euryale.AAC.7
MSRLAFESGSPNFGFREKVCAMIQYGAVPHCSAPRGMCSNQAQNSGSKVRFTAAGVRSMLGACRCFSVADQKIPEGSWNKGSGQRRIEGIVEGSKYG